MNLFDLFRAALVNVKPDRKRTPWQKKFKGWKKPHGFTLRHVRKNGEWVLEIDGAPGPPKMSTTFHTDSRGRRYNVYSDGSHRRVMTARGGRVRI